MKQIKTFRITEAGQERLDSLCKEFDRSEGYILNKLLELGVSLNTINRAVKTFK